MYGLYGLSRTSAQLIPAVVISRLAGSPHLSPHSPQNPDADDPLLGNLQPTHCGQETMRPTPVPRPQPARCLPSIEALEFDFRPFGNGTLVRAAG